LLAPNRAATSFHCARLINTELPNYFATKVLASGNVVSAIHRRQGDKNRISRALEKLFLITEVWLDSHKWYLNNPASKDITITGARLTPDNTGDIAFLGVQECNPKKQRNFFIPAASIPEGAKAVILGFPGVITRAYCAYRESLKDISPTRVNQVFGNGFLKSASPCLVFLRLKGATLPDVPTIGATNASTLPNNSSSFVVAVADPETIFGLHIGQSSRMTTFITVHHPAFVHGYINHVLPELMGNGILSTQQREKLIAYLKVHQEELHALNPSAEQFFFGKALEPPMGQPNNEESQESGNKECEPKSKRSQRPPKRAKIAEEGPVETKQKEASVEDVVDGLTFHPLDPQQFADLDPVDYFHS